MTILTTDHGDSVDRSLYHCYGFTRWLMFISLLWQQKWQKSKCLYILMGLA